MSSSSEAERRSFAGPDALPEPWLWLVLGTSLAAAILLPLIGSELLRFSVHHLLTSHNGLRVLFFFTTGLASAGTAAAVFAAAASRMPFIGVAVALVALVVVTLAERLLVEGPALLLLGGALGWWVHATLRSAGPGPTAAG